MIYSCIFNSHLRGRRRRGGGRRQSRLSECRPTTAAASRLAQADSRNEPFPFPFLARRHRGKCPNERARKSACMICADCQHARRRRAHAWCLLACSACLSVHRCHPQPQKNQPVSPRLTGVRRAAVGAFTCAGSRQRFCFQRQMRFQPLVSQSYVTRVRLAGTSNANGAKTIRK